MATLLPKRDARVQNILNRMTNRQRQRWHKAGRPTLIDSVVDLLDSTIHGCEYRRAMIEETGSQFFARRTA